jgi:propanol-preferring alcohol dehydrogenase
MRALQIQETGRLSSMYSGLKLEHVPVPEPSLGEVLIRVDACGVCHTEVDEIENRTPPSRFPMIPGHQVVGTVISAPGNYSGDYRSPGRCCMDTFSLRWLWVLQTRV